MNGEHKAGDGVDKVTGQEGRGERAFPALEDERRSALPTDAAAFHLSRRPATLYGWSCNEDGPLRPVRVNGRLAWRTDDIRRLLGVAK